MFKMMMSLLPIFFDYCYRYLFQVALFHFILYFLLHRTMWGLASATKRREA